MLNEMNERLDQIKEELRLHNKWTKQQKSLGTEIEDATTKLNDLKAKFHKENRDVEKLEGWTVTGLLLSMTGKKEERLQREKEEAVKAKLKFDEWKLNIEELEQDHREITEKLLELKNPEQRYEQLLREKEQMIHDSSSPLSELLFNLAQQSSEYKAQLKEVKEAKDAAEMALLKLEEAHDLLGSAKNWGMLDLAGGDLLSTYAKRSKMDDAQRTLHAAQRYLRRLEKELADLNIESAQTLQVSVFLNVTDMFFDNIFSDLMVQDKINRTIHQVSETRNKLRGLSSRLDQTSIGLVQDINETEDKKKRHLEDA
ncbi:hypothetical protein [Bacillus sp. AK031]